MADIVTTLIERGRRYGSFIGHSCITQDIKTTMHKSPKWRELDPDQKEALEMVAHKVGRILNGDPNYPDSWHDIVGYAKLVADRLLSAKPPEAPETLAPFLPATRERFLAERTGLGDAVRASGKRAKR